MEAGISSCLIRSCFEKYLGFHLTSWEHNASAAGESPSHSAGKDKKKSRNHNVFRKKNTRKLFRLLRTIYVIITKKKNIVCFFIHSFLRKDPQSSHSLILITYPFFIKRLMSQNDVLVAIWRFYNGLTPLDSHCMMLRSVLLKVCQRRSKSKSWDCTILQKNIVNNFAKKKLVTCPHLDYNETLVNFFLY